MKVVASVRLMLTIQLSTECVWLCFVGFLDCFFGFVDNIFMPEKYSFAGLFRLYVLEYIQ
jgi:hypothetical protein